MGRVPVLPGLQGHEGPAQGQEEGPDDGRAGRPGHGGQDRIREGPRTGLLGRKPGLCGPPSLRPGEPGQGKGQVDGLGPPASRARFGKRGQYRQRRRIRVRQAGRPLGPGHRRLGPGGQRPRAPGHALRLGRLPGRRQGLVQIPGLVGKGRSPGRPQRQGRQGLRGQALERRRLQRLQGPRGAPQDRLRPGRRQDLPGRDGRQPGPGARVDRELRRRSLRHPRGQEEEGRRGQGTGRRQDRSGGPGRGRLRRTTRSPTRTCPTWSSGMARTSASSPSSRWRSTRTNLQLSGRIPGRRKKIHPAGRRRRPRGRARAQGPVRHRPGRPGLRARRQPRRPQLLGRLCHRHEDGQADAGPEEVPLHVHAALRRGPLPLLRRRPFLHLRHGGRAFDQHHQGRAGLVRQRGGRPQRRQAARLSGRLDQGRPERAPLGRLGRLERPRRRDRQGRQPDRERLQGQAPLPAACASIPRRRPSTSPSPSTSASTANGRRRRASPGSTRAGRPRPFSSGTTPASAA